MYLEKYEDKAKSDIAYTVYDLSLRHQNACSESKCVISIRRKDEQYPNKLLNLSLISLTNGLQQIAF